MSPLVASVVELESTAKALVTVYVMTITVLSALYRVITCAPLSLPLRLILKHGSTYTVKYMTLVAWLYGSRYIIGQWSQVDMASAVALMAHCQECGFKNFSIFVKSKSNI